MTDLEIGTASIRVEKSGAISIYVKKRIAGLVTLPKGRDVKVEWNSKEETLCIKRLS